MEKPELSGIKKNYPIGRINGILSQFKKLKVLAIGDAIIDEDHFTAVKGHATKDPILSVD